MAYDKKKTTELWNLLVEAEGRLRTATEELVNSPKPSTKTRWEVEYDSFSEARESYEEYLEDIADSVEISKAD